LEQPFHVEKRQSQGAKTVGFSKGSFKDVETDAHKQERWENRGKSSRLNYNYIFKRNFKLKLNLNHILFHTIFLSVSVKNGIL